MTEMVVTLYHSRNLVAEWTLRTLRARYQQSILGWVWAVVQPAAQAAILAVVFTYFVPVDTGDVPYVLFVFTALAPWTFLALSLTDMTQSIVDNMTLVNKVYFAREALPIATMLARLVDLGITLGVVLVVASLWGAFPSAQALAALPIVVALQLALIAGLGLAAAALNVLVRDVRSIVQLGLQIWFYASPVVYPLDRVPAWLRGYYDLNPMAGILEAYRAVLLGGEWPDTSFALASIVSVAIFAAGCFVFARLTHRFADVI